MKLLKIKKKSLEYKKLRTIIDKATIAAQEAISFLAYLAKLEQQGRHSDVKYYKDLSEKEISYEIYDKLTTQQLDNNEVKDPILMGKKFMSEKATDKQMRDMIDEIYNKTQFINDDRYIKREERYKMRSNKAKEDIESKRQLLTEHYNRKISDYAMPELLKEYYSSHEPSGNKVEIEKEISILYNSINSYDYNEKVLKKIEQRKSFIQEQFKSHIEIINKYRLIA